MSVNEEIARLTGTLVWKADNRPLLAFQKNLGKVQSMLTEFAAVANKKFGIKVQLDAKSLRAQLDRAANAKVVFKNFSVDQMALEVVSKRICEKLDRTPIVLKNIRINASDVLAQRAMLRGQLENVHIQIKPLLKFQEANASLRAWKAATETKFKLHLNADISQNKLMQNAGRSFRAVQAKLGKVTVGNPKIMLSIDRQHLKAEIAAVLQQIKREVRVKIDLNSAVTGTPRRAATSAARAGMRAAERGGMSNVMGLAGGFMGGLLPSIGSVAAIGYTVAHLNKINQQQQGQMHAMMSVTGSAEAGAETKKRLDAMGNEIGFNSREMAPSFIRMIASGKGSNFTQAQSEGIFKAMTEYGRVMGLDKEEMKGSLKAVEQMMNKGQIMAEELKGQLGERFPAAVALMAKSQGMTIPQLLSEMKKGNLKSDALLKFAETIAKEARVGGALTLGERGNAAQQARMENSFSKSVESLSAGGFDQATSDFFKNVATAINKSQPLIKSLGATFQFLMTPVEAIIKLLGDLAEKWPDIAKGLGLTNNQLSILTVTGLMLLNPLGTIVLLFGGLALAIQDIVSFTQGKDSIFGKLLLGLSDEKLKNLMLLTQNFEDAKNSINDMADSVGRLLGLMTKDADANLFSKGVGWYFDQIIDKVRSTLLEIKSLADVINKLAKGDFGGAWDSMQDASVAYFHGGLMEKLLRPDLRRGMQQRYEDMQVGTGDRMLQRAQAKVDAKAIMSAPTGAQDIANGLGVSAATFTGPITLNFPNVTDAKSTDIEEAVNRVMGDSLMMMRANQKEVK